VSHRVLTRPVLEITGSTVELQLADAWPVIAYICVVEQALDMLGIEPGQTFIVAAKPVIEKSEPTEAGQRA